MSDQLLELGGASGPELAGTGGATAPGLLREPTGPEAEVLGGSGAMGPVLLGELERARAKGFPSASAR